MDPRGFDFLPDSREDMPQFNVLTLGVLINSALYFVAVLAAGLVWRNFGAVVMDVVAIGTTYMSYVFQHAYGMRHPISMWLAASSVGFGTIAGLVLLF